MTTRDIRDFLREFSARELEKRGVLNHSGLLGPALLLRTASVEPLLALMKERGVNRIESIANDWFLDEHGNFRNKKSNDLKEGNVSNLRYAGSVFWKMNTALNPHFAGNDIYVTVMDTRVTRRDILSAIRAFDREYPNPNDYAGWLANDTYRCALAYGKGLYPPKWILSQATDIPIRSLYGGSQTNGPFRKLGFRIIPRPFEDPGKRAAGPLDTLLKVEAGEAQAEGAFDPASVEDGRERAAANIVRRQGQPAFRNTLLTAYDYRCAISECDVVPTLEAAHITPYQGEATNHPGNGLLLRADIHSLFDQGLIAVNTKTMTVMIARSLRGTYYEGLADKPIRLPSTPALMPSIDALDQHRAWAGL